MGPDRVRGEPLRPRSSQHTQPQPIEFPSSWVWMVEPLRKARVWSERLAVSGAS